MVLRFEKSMRNIFQKVFQRFRNIFRRFRKICIVFEAFGRVLTHSDLFGSAGQIQCIWMHSVFFFLQFRKNLFFNIFELFFDGFGRKFQKKSLQHNMGEIRNKLPVMEWSRT